MKIHFFRRSGATYYNNPFFCIPEYGFATCIKIDFFRGFPNSKKKAVEAGKDDMARAALKAKTETEQALKSANDESENLDARLVQLEFDVATLKGKLVEA